MVLSSGKMADIAVILQRPKSALAVQTPYKVVGAVAQMHQSHCIADTGHDYHVQHNINGISQLDTNFCKFWNLTTPME